MYRTGTARRLEFELFVVFLLLVFDHDEQYSGAMGRWVNVGGVPDPHRFDGEKDGVGSARQAICYISY